MAENLASNYDLDTLTQVTEDKLAYKSRRDSGASRFLLEKPDTKELKRAVESERRIQS